MIRMNYNTIPCHIKKKANTFNQYFCNIGPELAETITQPISASSNFSYSCTSTFSLVDTSVEVIRGIDYLKIGKALKVDDIPTKFLKMAKTVLAPFLSVVFNKCVVKGVYPNSLKVAQVNPIHKKGDKSACTNYRPISLLSQCNKIFERILHHRFYSYIQDFELLTGHQFGFRPNSSTSLALESIYSDLLHNYDSGLFTGSLFIDLSKAFDTVNHNILIKNYIKIMV